MTISSQTALRLASALLGVTALGAVGWYTYSAFDSGFAISEMRPGLLLAAFGVHIALIAALPFLWIWLLKMLGSDSDRQVSLADPGLYAMYARSWLARYVPGRVWMFGGRVLYGRQAGISARAISSSSFFEAAISYSAIGILGAAFLAGAWLHWSVIPAIAIVGIASTWFVLKVAMAGNDTVSRSNSPGRLLAKISPWITGAGKPTDVQLAAIVIAYWVHALLQVIFFVLVAFSVSNHTSNETLLLAGAWGVGAAAGYISVFSAGGLGVRDGVALAFVGPALTGSVAATIVAASRIILVVADLALVALVEVAALAVRTKRNRAVQSGPQTALTTEGVERA